MAIYKDELKSIRRAAELLNRYARGRALVASGVALTEMRARGEAHRFETISQLQFDLTRRFVNNVAAVNGFEESVPAEFKDALKERAFNDYMDALNRSSRIVMPSAKPAGARHMNTQGTLWKD